MNEGRKSQIVLLDDGRLDILIQPRLYVTELLDLVASHFQLREKEYFGLSFVDETGHHNWLQSDRRVLEHDFPTRSGVLLLYFGVRFFLETIAGLKDTATIELFYLQAKQNIYKGIIECDSETAFELAAHALQATHGDYINDYIAKDQLKKLPFLPTSALREHPSISYCEDQVLGHYRKLSGQSRGLAVVNYMTIAESLPTYGIHYYEVKDKSSIPWWLGISHRGIAQYDYTDKKIPRKVFGWRHLENLYFRDKKFSIEVHDPKRVSVSRRTFGPSKVSVYAWFGSTPQLTKCVWSMAVCQHQFYLDRKQSKAQLPSVRSMSEIAAELGQSTSSLHSSSAYSDSISRTDSAPSLSLSASKVDLTAEQLEVTQAAQRDMFTALKARKDALEEALKKKTAELKALCIKEGELTGKLPPEYPHSAGEQRPNIRKRIGTSYSLSPNIFNREPNVEEELLGKLELHYDLQTKITSAALKLAHDTHIPKSTRKKRKQSYHNAHTKLKELEKKLNEVRLYAGKTLVKAQTPSSSLEDLSEDGLPDSGHEFVSPASSPAVFRSAHAKQVKLHTPRDSHVKVKITRYPKVQIQNPSYPETKPPSSPSSFAELRNVPVTTSPSHQLSTPSPNRLPLGYTPNSVYTTRTMYRNQTYPTFSTRSHSSSSTQSDSDTNVMIPSEQAYVQNLYNVATKKTSHYGSYDELKTPTNPEPVDSYFDVHLDRGDGITRSGSVEGAHNKLVHDYSHYGSLDRKLVGLNLDSLTPSKFGCKRDSHSDYRDSLFYKDNDRTPTGPPPDIREESVDYNSPQTIMHDSTVSYHGYPGSQDGSYHDDASIEYADEPSTAHQKYYQDPAMPVVVGQTPTDTLFARQINPAHDNNLDSTGNTVTQYQNFVEISKPFEMSDFYKYSERLRRQRSSTDSPSSDSTSGGQSSSSHTPYKHPASPYLPHRSLDDTYSAQPSTAFLNPLSLQSRSRSASPHVDSKHFYSSHTPGSSRTTPHTLHTSPYNVQSTPLSSASPHHAHYRKSSLPDSVEKSQYPDSSFTIETGGSLAAAFSEEMLAWYEDQEQPKKATLV